jgi:hypothetical protein
MTGRRTNLGLLGALVVAFATGWTAFAAGTGWGRPVVVIHGIAGLTVVALAPWKSVIARRGLRKKRKGKPSSLVLAVLVVVSLAAGIAHSLADARAVGGLTVMQVHVGAAVAAVPFAIVHLVRRPTAVRRTDVSRRNLLRGLGVLGGGALIYGALEGLSGLLALPGSARRFTGSHERGSHDPERMPVTQWLNDSVPSINAAGWRLQVRSGGNVRHWSLDELVQHEGPLTATLDCTGGWYSEQDWSAVPLRVVLSSVEGRSVMVRSTTGYSRRFPRRDVDHLFLATSAAGAPLSPGHGYLIRLVAPGRRGFWWVKWVDLVQVDNQPWWLQLPFPAE